MNFINATMRLNSAKLTSLDFLDFAITWTPQDSFYRKLPDFLISDFNIGRAEKITLSQSSPSGKFSLRVQIKMGEILAVNRDFLGEDMK